MQRLRRVTGTRRPHPVLAAVGTFPESDEVLRLASRHAAALDTDLVVCHVNERGEDELTIEELQIRTHVITGRTDVDSFIVISQGLPAFEIGKLAAEFEASLVVIGDGAPHSLRVGGDALDRVLELGIPVLIARASPETHRIVVPDEPHAIEVGLRESMLFDGEVVQLDDGAPVTQILQVVTEQQAELIVVETTPGGVLARALDSSRRIVSEAPCSVLAVPPTR
jgi:nucleotide-binding universal stress UspA family protein